jgi:hypothetical protein
MITEGQRVRVYYNIRKKCLSVMDKKTRLVIARPDFISLDNVKFIVSAAGLARVRREKRKSVIAFVEGDYTFGRAERIIFNPEWVRAYFNPYKVDQFMVGELPICEAGQVYIVDKNIYVKETQCVSS